MGNVKEFIKEVEILLLVLYSNIGIDKPTNHDDILEFIANDIQETADPENWHDGDVAIAFRRWIEAQAKEDIEETNLPENFSDVEIRKFKEEWGQYHNEITANLGYPLSHNESDELLMVDYFWNEEEKMWYPKSASLYSEREQAIADYLRNS